MEPVQRTNVDRSITKSPEAPQNAGPSQVPERFEQLRPEVAPVDRIHARSN